jgi:1,6-anhydro-N-acetylmuramate kinase
VGEHQAFIDAPPPKSTGREVFGSVFVQKNCLHLISDGTDAAAKSGKLEFYAKTLCQNFFDLCRTAIEFTAWTIAKAYHKHLPPFQTRSTSDKSQHSTEPPSSSTSPSVLIVVLSGGGASNPVMVDRIRALLTDECEAAESREIVVTTLDDQRLKNTARPSAAAAADDNNNSTSHISWGDAKEAVAFAILAHEKLNEVAGVFSPWCFETGEVGTNVLSATGASRGVVLGQLSVPTVAY